VFSSPGVFSEVLHLFYATELEPSTVAHESAEVIEVHWIPFDEAYDWAMSGRIRDAKTIIALARVFAIDAVRKGTAAGNP
jgi:ADP-ribose pyrophosphatase